MSSYKNPLVVAEAACNHLGKIEIAKQLIAAAHASGADYVKFQKRCPRELLPLSQYDAPHPNPQHAFGKTYGEHREALEFTIEQHVELAKFCKSSGIRYTTSVWDLTSARQIVEYINPDYIKVPSSQNQNEKLIEYLLTQYRGDVHISMGMLTRREMCKVFGRPAGDRVSLTESAEINLMKRLVYYACTSGYPVPFDKVYLQEVSWLKSRYGGAIPRIGFSGHHLGTAVDIAAYALGAEFIERHLTLDRTWKGTDHACSLEPNDLHRLVRDLKSVYAAMQFKKGIDYRDIDDLDPIEDEQRRKLKYKEKCEPQICESDGGQ